MNQPTTGAVTLRFHEAPLQIIRIDGNAWVRGVDVGRALGYKKPGKSIHKLFASNSDEFSDEMTLVLQVADFTQQLDGGNDDLHPRSGDAGGDLHPRAEAGAGDDGQVADGGQLREVRLFSARGVHLLAMMARTTIAKEFRRWALDVLDGACAKKQPEPLTLAQEMSLIRLSVSLMDKVAACKSMDLAEELFRRLMRVNRAMGWQTIPFMDLALACRQRSLPLADDDLGDLAAH